MKTLYRILILFLFTNVSFTQNVYHWYQIPSGTTNNLYSIAASSLSNWITGASGIILKSYGGGWTQVSSGTSRDLHGFLIASLYTFYIPGSNGIIIKSTSSGYGWIVLNTGVTANLNSMTMNFVNSVMAVGSSGTIIHSTDGGQTWIQHPGVTSYNLNSSGYTNNTFKYFDWIVGDHGTILRSTDLGTTWVLQNSGTTANLNCVSVLDSNLVWICGDNGKILRTTNGGLNWVTVPSVTSANLKSLWLSQSGGWAVGTTGILLRTTDSGLTWVIQSPFTNIDLNSIYGGIIVGNNGVIFQRQIDSNYLPYAFLNMNNVSSIFSNTGIFDQDIRTYNTPGFEWPKGSHQDAIFSAGLTVAAKFNGSIRMAAAMYAGEFLPGHIIDSAGIPVARSDSTFKFYSVKKGDNMYNNPDWANWGDMVPFGAPFIDVNHNGTYEPNIDTPGVKNAAQTIFVCLTDGFPQSHTPNEGFGGGTLPLYIESHMTAWCYNAPDVMDVQFIKWDVINKSYTPWTSAYFSITSDPDLGCPTDDYIGCDTVRSLAFCYNGEDNDCTYFYQYQSPVPAVGFLWLRCNGVQNLGLTSVDYVGQPGEGYPQCEWEPNPGYPEAYNFIKGKKGDETPWVVPPGGIQNVTKFLYSGDPETGQGWCEAQSNISGSVKNCGGPNIYTGTIIPSNLPGDRRLILNSGSDNLTINPGDTQKIMIAQLIARGTSRKNSVTRLKILADTVKAVCSRGFIIGLEPISQSIPTSFALFHNYPNPFNPSTKIKFQIPKSGKVQLKIWDILGREVATLVNEKLNPGKYEVEWDGSAYASGVYFYRLSVSDPETSSGLVFNQTKRMVLIK